MLCEFNQTFERYCLVAVKLISYSLKKSYCSISVLVYFAEMN